MKTIVGSLIAAIAASACCIGPVVASLVGAGALGAAAVRLEPLRPSFLCVTAVLLGSAFYLAYRRAPDACAPNGSCAPASRRMAKMLLWMATVLVILLVTFPYYVNRLL